MVRRLLLVGLMSVPLLAETPSRPAPPPPLPPPPPPVYSNRPLLPNPPPTALSPRPRNGSNWDRLQDSLDRSTGRITDEQLFQTERTQRLRDERLQQLQPEREFDRLQEERDRRLRIEDRARRSQPSDQQVQNELDRRQYELYLNNSTSAMTAQTLADEQALRAATAKRDTDILSANDTRTSAIQKNPDQRDQIEGDFQNRVTEIRSNYDATRRQILGVSGATTQSTTAPTE